jgi:hypothetical protein
VELAYVPRDPGGCKTAGTPEATEGPG